jgi:NADH dehydrogenase
VLLLTGATGTVGSALLRRLTAARIPVRCLVRDPRRLGAERVRVQLALGDLADPPSFRNALRGVTTVVHLAASARDQPAGSIEELNGIATWRMVEAAERAGVEHFVFASALGASTHHRARVLRAKALAEQAVADSGLRHTVIAPSLIYAPDDRLARTLSRLALLPAVPMVGRGRAQSQPIWAEDVAECLERIIGDGPAPPRALGGRGERFELAGPETYTAAELLQAVLRGAGRPRQIVPVPHGLASRALRAGEALLKSAAPVTWDEAELLTVPMTSRLGTADAEGLGVVPKRVAAVLGAG